MLGNGRLTQAQRPGHPGHSTLDNRGDGPEAFSYVTASIPVRVELIADVEERTGDRSIVAEIRASLLDRFGTTFPPRRRPGFERAGHGRQRESAGCCC